MIVNLVISLPVILYVHRIGMVLIIGMLLIPHHRRAPCGGGVFGLLLELARTVFIHRI